MSSNDNGKRKMEEEAESSTVRKRLWLSDNDASDDDSSDSLEEETVEEEDELFSVETRPLLRSVAAKRARSQ
jgi:hypothetical protein